MVEKDVDATARLRELEAEMRGIAIAAGQCSVEGPTGTMSDMAAAEAERASRWAEQLAEILSSVRSTPQEGTTDELTRSVELAVNPPPQHAATDREDS